MICRPNGSAFLRPPVRFRFIPVGGSFPYYVAASIRRSLLREMAARPFALSFLSQFVTFLMSQVGGSLW